MAFTHSHNNWWHRREMAWGQWFVAEPRANAAAYDCAHQTPVVWFPASPFKNGSVSHRIWDAVMEQAARMSAAKRNQAAA